MTEAPRTEGTGLLDGVEAAPPFNMDSYVEEVRQTPKQHYESAWKAPEVEPAQVHEDPTVAEAHGKVQAKERARQRGSEMLINMVDRGQATAFTWFGAKGHEKEFRFRTDDKDEMTEYLAEALPENFYMSPWIPLAVIFTAAMGANVAKLQEIRAANKRAAEEIARKARKDAAEQEAKDMELQELRDLRAERDRRRAADAQRQQTAPPPAPAPPATDKLCEECHTNPVVGNNRYCGMSCRGKANGRKAQPPK